MQVAVKKTSQVCSWSKKWRQISGEGFGLSNGAPHFTPPGDIPGPGDYLLLAGITREAILSISPGAGQIFTMK